MITFFIILLVIGVVFVIVYGRAEDVKQDMIDEALDRGDEERAEEIEDMSEDDIIENHGDRF